MFGTLEHFWATLAVVAFLLYVLPSVIAFSRQPPNAGSIYVVNLLLGWTIWGWVTALAMAVRSKPTGVRGPSKIVAPARSSCVAESPLPLSQAAPAASTLDSFLRDREV